MRIVNVETSCRKLVKTVGNFHILEYTHDASVSPTSAVNEYFMGKMNVRRRQVLIEIDKDHSAVIQAGAMQWMGGHVEATTGVKGIGAGADIQTYYSSGYFILGTGRYDD